MPPADGPASGRFAACRGPIPTVQDYCIFQQNPLWGSCRHCQATRTRSLIEAPGGRVNRGSGGGGGGGARNLLIYGRCQIIQASHGLFQTGSAANAT